MSLKISFNADHTSKGFGYATFESEEAAKQAVDKGAHIDADKVVALPFKDLAN